MVQSLKAQKINMLHIILVYLIYACSLWFICSQSKREFLKKSGFEPKIVAFVERVNERELPWIFRRSFGNKTFSKDQPAKSTRHWSMKIYFFFQVQFWSPFLKSKYTILQKVTSFSPLSTKSSKYFRYSPVGLVHHRWPVTGSLTLSFEWINSI